jgi:hypothetical protein
MVPLVINELLARVPTDDPNTEEIEGDANGDGTRNANLDEFVEIVNVGTDPIGLSGYEVDDNGGTAGSFVFPTGTRLPAGEAVVIFGGGDLTMSKAEFGNARALGLVFTATGNVGLGFSNTGDSVVVKDPTGREVVRLDYDANNPVAQPVFQSFNRNPDVTGSFSNHRDVEGAASRAYSPGTQINGRAFRRVISGLVPNSGPLAGGNEVTIDGAGFGSQIMSVTFGDQAIEKIERVNSLQLKVIAPPRATPGAVDVTVTDSFGNIVGTGVYTYQ